MHSKIFVNTRDPTAWISWPKGYVLQLLCQ